VTGRDNTPGPRSDRDHAPRPGVLRAYPHPVAGCETPHPVTGRETPRSPTRRKTMASRPRINPTPVRFFCPSCLRPTGYRPRRQDARCADCRAELGPPT
jgi:hypothetical protein